MLSKPKWKMSSRMKETNQHSWVLSLKKMSRNLLNVFIGLMEEIVKENHNKQVAFLDGTRDMVLPKEANAFLTLNKNKKKLAIKSHKDFMEQIG